MRYEPQNFYIRSTEEMEELFAGYPDAVENTQRIADRCRFDFTFGKYHLPEFQLPEGYDSPTYLRELCQRGFRARYGENPAYHRQLDYELDMIGKMGFTDYFLIVQDFVNYAKGAGILSLIHILKLYTKNLTAIVTVADDGGGSGRLRQDLGMPPPGDIRSCLAVSYTHLDVYKRQLQEKTI